MTKFVLLLTAVVCLQSTPVSSCGIDLPPVQDMARKQEAYTWFTIHGNLFRKHDNSATAELWYGCALIDGEWNRNHGRLTEKRVASHILLTPQNSSLPSAEIVDIRFDKHGKIWFASYRGDFASFDGNAWEIVPKPKLTKGSYEYRRVWPPQTPFAGDAVRLRVPAADEIATDVRSSIESWTQAIPKQNRTMLGLTFIPVGLVYSFAVHPNGALVMSSNEGIHIFRPLAEGEVAPEERLRAAAPYPNPASSDVTFSLVSEVGQESEETVDPMTVDILDLTGRVRSHGTEGVATGLRTNVNDLEEGVYVAVLRTKEQVTSTRFCVRR